MPPAPASLPITPLSRPPQARVLPPGSKSYTNRALVLAALASGPSTLDGALFSDDTRLMAGALTELGFAVDSDEAGRRFTVQGGGGSVPRAQASLWIGNAGTAARFLPPLMALGHGEYLLDGSPAMRRRPVQPLLDGLAQLGGEASSLNGDGCPPLRVRAKGLRGGSARLPGGVSSQYFTGLLMAGACAREGISLEVEGELVSRPYLDMTAQAMAAFGVELENHDYRRFSVRPGQRYRAARYAVEPDASAASYFFAAAAICGGEVTIPGLGSHSLQGDLGFVRVLEAMGCSVVMSANETTVRGPQDGRLRGASVNMADLSDTAQTLAAVAPFADGPVSVTGIGFIRRKETDRIAAVVRELRRLGIEVSEDADGFTVQPGRPQAASVHTYDDHRMAMSFALIGLRVPGIEILDPGCVSKTFPDYFAVLEQLRR